MNKPKPILLDGEALARRIRDELSLRASNLCNKNIRPVLAMLRVGENPASAAYVGRKLQDCAQVGITTREITLPVDCSAETLSSQIETLNSDPSVHGILVQLPLPAHLDDHIFVAKVAPHKDADGLHPFNLGQLVSGVPTLLPCTPAAILALLQHHNIPLNGRKVLIIGRGSLVGRPLALLLMSKGIDATVTVAHSATPDIKALALEADIIISAAGVPDLITADMVKPGAAVLGIGISYNKNSEMISDIASNVTEKAQWITPPQGSVGAVTRAFLLSNLLQIAEQTSSIYK